MLGAVPSKGGLGGLEGEPYNKEDADCSLDPTKGGWGGLEGDPST